MGDAAGSTRGSGVPRWVGAVVPVVGVALGALPLILMGSMAGRGAFDQLNYHEPMIRRFAEAWPSVDLSNYLSATTPLYHLLLAGLAVLQPGPASEASDTLLRLAGLVFAMLAVGGLGWWVSARAGAISGALCGLALGSGLYFFASAAWLLPDDAGWAGVLLVLALCLRPRLGVAGLFVAGLAVLLLVLVRQSHVWTAAIVWTAAWLSALDWDEGETTEPWEDIVPLLARVPRSLGRVGVGVVATVPAFAAVAWFHHHWGGFVPPVYHSYMQGANPAVVSLIGLQLAIIGGAFAGFWLPSLVAAWHEASGARQAALTGAFACAALVGLAIALGPETTWNKDEGRWSGYWNLTQKLPDVLGRTNLGFVVACPVGCVALLGLLRGADRRTRWVVLGALVSAAAALTINQNAWQRYQEPLLVILLSLLAASCAGWRPAGGTIERVARVVGPGLLVLMYVGITASSLSSAEPAVLLDRHPRVEEPLRDLWPPSWQDEPPASWSGAGSQPE
ncbi:MAG: hypothetical protein AAGI53_03090 [Planctomycetota bacterium]